MPLVQRLIAVSVQCGVPEDDEIVFNIHLTNNATGLVWDVTYSFSQLATLDHDISFHCDNMKEIPFPQIDEAMMHKLASKKHYTGKLQDLNKYRTLIEAWIQKLISRVHLMPFVLYVFVEDWFCLPVGPDSEWTPGRALSSQELDKLSRIKRADNYAAAAEITTASTAHSDDKSKHGKGFMKFLGFGKKSGDAGDSGDKRKKDGKSGHGPPTPEVFLLKLQVHRGQRGRNGKVEYDIQIDHAHKGRPHTVSRSYSVFRKLSVILSRVQAMSSPGSGAGGGSNPGPVGGGSSSAMPRSTSSASGDEKGRHRGQLTVTFPEPPLRCSFGLSLTEAHLSYRTRQLDSWLRDVICNYKYMQELERAAVRYFLDLDMSRAVDISIQDRLARGQVEAPRANVFVQTALREKDISEISEVKTERSGRSRGGGLKLLGVDERKMMQESKSDNGRSGGKGGQMLWETSSMASSHCAGSEIGRAKLFHAKVRAGELTTEKLASLQSEIKNSNNNRATLAGGATRPKCSSPGSDSHNSNSAHGKKGDVGTADQVRNQYRITNALSRHNSLAGETSATDSYGSPNKNGIASDGAADGRLLDAGERDSNDGSVIVDREMDEDSLMRIGMGDDGGAMGGKNKATTDQWVAREFNTKSTCVVS